MYLLRRLCTILVVFALVGVVARAADDKKPVDGKKEDTKKEKKKAKPVTFSGEVVKQEGTKLWVKHANGTIKEFSAGGSTKITGAPNIGAILKGSMVTVESTKKSVVSIQVTKLATRGPKDAEEGKPVHGTLTEVKTDQYGDSGTICVKTANGKVHEFNCTNATRVRHPDHPDWLHTMQFLKKGQTVIVEHDGHHIALKIKVE